MIQKSPLVSSVNSELNVNFRISHNSKTVIDKIKQIQRNNIEDKKKRISNICIEHEIYREHGAPFILLKTNLRKTPIRMMIDTGASISLISKNVITENINKLDLHVNIFGIAGKDVSVQTEGMVNAILKFGKQFLTTSLHVVDPKYSGTCDGYLGYISSRITKPLSI